MVVAAPGMLMLSRIVWAKCSAAARAWVATPMFEIASCLIVADREAAQINAIDFCRSLAG